ncbi:SH2 domain-containing protein 3A [Tachyglossus aculeatus]|uniref:SH2 domain-containing protein 3A n=1 Tax=Tachyglossus aculeatus TaxID=9261 RepID=UPI0018F362F0|nr:SH2 domain-containing protein 3A [Tachyglossus aculeatus]XP_038627786.1 SH2 domain-containing protein 3A [Tachyglossus aculeatus]XP_038627787.1 SH2 domain-containing protein 3A [Tachyglossus aculeatus]
MALAPGGLRTELEEELKLSKEELRSYAWYHGCLPRQEAELLLQKDGEFLIRDSRSSPGDYVLVCRWEGTALHFRIIRVVLRPRQGRPRALFQLEQELFDSLPALICCYVGNRRFLSEASGAMALSPVNRLVPLRCIEELHRDQMGSANPRRRSLSGDTPGEVVAAAAAKGSLLRSKDRSGSHPAGLEQLGRRPSLYSAQSEGNLLTGNHMVGPDRDQLSQPPASPLFRTGSEPVLLARAQPVSVEGAALRGSDGQLHCKPPPKPLRVSLLLEPSEPQATYCELVPRAPAPVRSHTDRLGTEERRRHRARATETAFGFLEAELGLPACQEEEEEEGKGFVRPDVAAASSFQPRAFPLLLLSPDNRPLEIRALQRLKDLFSQQDSRTTALHLLQMDCQAARILGLTREQKQAMGVWSGLELITLPHGHQLRLDLLERHHLLALGIAVDVLGCTGPVGERAATLHKIIQLALELKSGAGDLFALSAIMKALQLSQITRLEQTWRQLRQDHTASALAFEKQLKPFVKALDEGAGGGPPGQVVVPHLLPLMRLMEGEDLWGPQAESCELLYQTFQTARAVAAQATQYHAAAEAKLQGFQPIPELAEAFRTEFALRFFWGSQGAEATPAERHKKFNQILTVLSYKLEPEG